MKLEQSVNYNGKSWESFFNNLGVGRFVVFNASLMGLDGNI